MITDLKKKEIDELLRKLGYAYAYQWKNDKIVLTTASLSVASAIKGILICNMPHFDYSNVNINISIELK